MKRGDIFWVDFGKAPRRPIRKRRPALVIQNDAANKHSPYVIVAAIHHETGKCLPVHVSLLKGTSDLSKDSVVDCGAISTLPKAMLGPRIGRLGPAAMRLVDAALKTSLDLRDP